MKPTNKQINEKVGEVIGGVEDRNYCEDANLLPELYKHLQSLPGAWWDFAAELPVFPDDGKFDCRDASDIEIVSCTLTLTPREQCEAFLTVLGLWPICWERDGEEVEADQ